MSGRVDSLDWIFYAAWLSKFTITMYLRIKALALVRNSASFYFYLIGTDTCLYFIVFKCIIKILLSVYYSFREIP